MALAEENWDSSTLPSDLANFSISPIIPKNGDATLMPPFHLSADMLEEELSSEHNLVFMEVKGLIQHIFIDKAIPFTLNKKLMDALMAVWKRRPDFLIDKLLDSANRAVLKASNASPLKSHEVLLTEFFNEIGECMSTITLITNAVGAEGYRCWDAAAATAPIPDDTSTQKPDLILREALETIVDSWISVRVVCEQTISKNFPARTKINLLKRKYVFTIRNCKILKIKITVEIIWIQIIKISIQFSS